ncbi:Uncharacterised protein [Serratia ficaria]|nr:Uncharacterised protein [Serratia ficaria]
MTFKGPLLFVVTLFFCAGFFFSFVVTGLLGENTDYPIAFMIFTALFLVLGIGFFRGFVKIVDELDTNK